MEQLASSVISRVPGVGRQGCGEDGQGDAGRDQPRRL